MYEVNFNFDHTWSKYIYDNKENISLCNELDTNDIQCVKNISLFNYEYFKLQYIIIKTKVKSNLEKI